MSINGIKIEDVVREFEDDKISRHNDMCNALSYNSARNFQGKYCGSKMVTLERNIEVSVGMGVTTIMPEIYARDLYMYAYQTKG